MSELKIGPKRFRKEIKKHIDARDRQRGVKLALRACRQRRVKLALRACRQRGVKLALRENCLGGVVGLFLARFGCSRGPFKAGFGCSRGPLKGRNRLDGCQKLGLKKKNHEENRTSNISFYVFFCDFFGADPRVKIDRGQFSLVSLLASS